MADLQLTAARKVYANGTVAVRDLSLEARDHELLVLLGPSGCGKTTTLRLVAGLEKVTSGTIRIGGKVVTAAPPHQRGVAMLFQTPALYPHLRVGQNLSFSRQPGYRFAFWRKPAVPGDVEEMARIVRIGHLLDRRPAELSGGERQRVALARALLRHPDILLLDEPLAHVDPALRLTIRRELRILLTELGITTVWVTHDHTEALALGDRVGVLREGRLEQLDTPSALYDRPGNRFVAGLVGSPPMNLLAGRLEATGSAVRFLSEAIAIDLPRAAAIPLAIKGEILLGIRPQDMKTGEVEEAPLHLQTASIEYGEGFQDIVLAAPGASLTCRWPGRLPLKKGDWVSVHWDWNQVHWFDAASGARLEKPHD
jgi:multiple sugar transport system ATP-binding protein